MKPRPASCAGEPVGCGNAMAPQTHSRNKILQSGNTIEKIRERNSMRGGRAIDPIYICPRKKETIHEEVPHLGPRSCSRSCFQRAGHRRGERGCSPHGKASSPSSSSSPPPSPSSPPPSSPSLHEEDGEEGLIPQTTNEKTSLGFLFKAGLLLVIQCQTQRESDAVRQTALARAASDIFQPKPNRDTAGIFPTGIH